jgi:hypothetical protein
MQRLTPDLARLVFADGDALRAIDAGGMQTAVTLAADVDGEALFAATFSVDSAFLAVTDGSGALLRVRLGDSPAAEVLEPAGGAQVGFTGISTTMVWLASDGTLRVRGPSDTENTTVASGVSMWVPIPGADSILYLADNVLYAVDL